jgi:hypothetical protein
MLVALFFEVARPSTVLFTAASTSPTWSEYKPHRICVRMFAKVVINSVPQLDVVTKASRLDD